MTFLWDITKGAYQFSKKEDKIMRWLLDVLIKECPKTCSFLNVLELSKVQFYWAPYMTHENGVAGAWCITSPNRIYLIRVDDNRLLPTKGEENNVSRSGLIRDIKTLHVMSGVVDSHVGVTMIHELIHKLQFSVSPLAYVFNRLITLFIDRVPFLEMIGIEYDARANSETDELIDFLEQFSNSLSSYESAIRCKSPADPENFLYNCWNGCDDDGTPHHSEKIKKLTLEFFDLINED